MENFVCLLTRWKYVPTWPEYYLSCFREGGERGINISSVIKVNQFMCARMNKSNSSSIQKTLSTWLSWRYVRRYVCGCWGWHNPESDRNCHEQSSISYFITEKCVPIPTYMWATTSRTVANSCQGQDYTQTWQTSILDKKPEKLNSFHFHSQKNNSYTKLHSNWIYSFIVPNSFFVAYVCPYLILFNFFAHSWYFK